MPAEKRTLRTTAPATTQTTFDVLTMKKPREKRPTTMNDYGQLLAKAPLAPAPLNLGRIPPPRRRTNAPTPRAPSPPR